MFKNKLLPILFLLCLAVPAAAAPINQYATQTLIQKIKSRSMRVPEFVEIRRMAQELGLRVWLFGGTAAAFAHYVKWDLQRTGGDPRFQADRFDYDFTNIFRSTQDADLVVDGTADEIREFQKAVQNRFPYFMGSKEQWEVRSLRYDVGGKEALLNNPDFLNQHTDSHSTGMIELTDRGDPVVRDLREWASTNPRFLQDVAEGKLHYYFSNKHETTPRFKEGKNPPIFSVIRYFTKVFQLELETREEDLKRIRHIVDSFDPKSIKEGYVKGWLERNAPKLFKHAVDVEYASNVLDQFGLREKLIESSFPDRQGSLGWWMSKEPLRKQGGAGVLQSQEVTGKTAKDLGIEIVTHETMDFLAYEAIRRSHKGVPNVFISRNDKVGESAAYGNGFYTRIGRQGGRDTGFHIRMRVHPEAREGVDFVVVGGSQIVLWLTRDKLQVIQESLIFKAVDVLHFLLDPKNSHERGIREVFKRKLSHLSSSPEEQNKIESILKEGIQKSDPVLIDEILYEEILRFPPEKLLQWTQPAVASAMYPERFLKGILSKREVIVHRDSYEVVDAIINKWPGRRMEYLGVAMSRVLSRSEARWYPKWEEWVLEAINYTHLGQDRNGYVYGHVADFLRSEAALEHPDWEKWMDSFFAGWEKLKNENYYESLSEALRKISAVLAEERIMNHPKWPSWVGKFLTERSAVDYFLVQERVRQHPLWVEWIDRLLRSHDFKKALNLLWRDKEFLIDHEKFPEWMDFILADPRDGEPRARVINRIVSINEYVIPCLSLPSAKKYPQWERWVEQALELRGKSLFFKGSYLDKSLSAINAFDYFRILSERKLTLGVDHAIRDHLREQVIRQMEGFTSEQEREFVRFIRGILKRARRTELKRRWFSRSKAPDRDRYKHAIRETIIHETFLLEWMRLPVSKKYLSVIDAIKRINDIHVPQEHGGGYYGTGSATVHTLHKGMPFLVLTLQKRDKAHKTLWHDDKDILLAVLKMKNCEELLLKRP